MSKKIQGTVSFEIISMRCHVYQKESETYTPAISATPGKGSRFSAGWEFKVFTTCFSELFESLSSMKIEY